MIKLLKKIIFEERDIDFENICCFKTISGNWVISEEDMWHYLKLNSLGQIEYIYPIDSEDTENDVYSFNEYMKRNFDDELVEAYFNDPTIKMIETEV